MNLPPLAGIYFMLVKVPEEQKNISALNDSEASKIVPEVQKKDMVKTVSSAEHTKASHKKKGHSGVTKPSVNSSVSGEKTDNNNKISKTGVGEVTYMAKTEVVAMILAGGQGSRLGVLTKKIAKAGGAFGSRYRIIDFPLSNCVNSGIEIVGVLTQYQPLALNTYVGNGHPWDLDRNNAGAYILPPFKSRADLTGIRARQMRSIRI